MNGYLAASRGSVLPDIDRLKEEALGYSQYGDSNMGGKHTLTFSLAEPATVSVGWVVTFRIVYLDESALYQADEYSGYSRIIRFL